MRGRSDAGAGSACAGRNRRTECRRTPRDADTCSSRASRRGRRGDVTEAAGAEDALLAVDFETRRAGVDEVELVLRVVVVADALGPRWIDDHVGAEGGDPERRAHLAEAVVVAELVECAECVC